MDRLSSLDESFLRVETPTTHMHVGWLATVRLRPGTDRLDVGEVADRLNARLHLVPRFRAGGPCDAARPGRRDLVDCPDFRLDDHLSVERQGRVGAPALARLADRFFSDQLPRSRPLWQLHVIPRLPGGFGAVLGKVHHAMVDGMAAVQLGLLLFDVDPEAQAGEPQPWHPAPPTGIQLAVDTARDSALAQFRAARRAAALGLTPGRGVRVADTVRRSAFALVEDALRPAPGSYLNPEIGARRRLVGAEVPLPRLNAIKRRTDTKLNDVVLALVAGVLGRLAMAHGRTPRDVRGHGASQRAHRLGRGGRQRHLVPVRGPAGGLGGAGRPPRRLKGAKTLIWAERRCRAGSESIARCSSPSSTLPLSPS